MSHRIFLFVFIFVISMLMIIEVVAPLPLTAQDYLARKKAARENAEKILLEASEKKGYDPSPGASSRESSKKGLDEKESVPVVQLKVKPKPNLRAGQGKAAAVAAAAAAAKSTIAQEKKQRSSSSKASSSSSSKEGGGGEEEEEAIGLARPQLPKKPKYRTGGLRLAFCVTGQLARLEMHTKIENVLVANAKAGNIPHLFVWLDNSVEEVKQTYWNYNYSESVFGSYTRQDLKAYVDRQTAAAGFSSLIRTRVKLEPPTRYEFHVIDGQVPVKDKAYTGHDGPRSNFEPATSRFQNNMRWMAGLRDCVKWVQIIEESQGWFYDIVIRLRDDTYAMGPWIIDDSYKKRLTSAKTGAYHGINDHNFAIDREWADTLFRGLTEDYYFNSTLEKVPWGNPEHRIYELATSYNIPLASKTICEQPLMPLRGLVNSSYWRLHPLYIRHFRSDCVELMSQRACCEESWLRLVASRTAPAYPPITERIIWNPALVNRSEEWEEILWRRGELARREEERKREEAEAARKEKSAYRV